MPQYSSQPPTDPDALQALLNQANTEAPAPTEALPTGLQAYLKAQAGPTPMASIGQPATPPPTSTNPLSQTPAVQPRGPKRQNANEEELAGYQRQANEAIGAQGGGLDALQAYIKDMQGKPQGINWTPLAAYIDSQNPKSKMLEAAKAMAPMSPEERDKQLFDLQVKLQSGRAAMSADQLKALGEQIKMRRDADRDAWTKQYQDRMATAAETKADNTGTMAGTRQDTQAANAVKEIHKFPALLQMRQQATNIAKGQELLNGDHVPNKTLSEVAQDYAAALSGKAAASDFKLKDLMTPSAQSELSNALAWVNANPGDQDAPPKVLAYWRNMGERLSGTYQTQMSAAAQSRLTGLKTAFAHNPNAYNAAKEAADSYGNGAWMGTEGLADTSTSHHAYNAPSSSASHVDDAGNTWVVKDGHWVKK